MGQKDTAFAFLQTSGQLHLMAKGKDVMGSTRIWENITQDRHLI